MALKEATAISGRENHLEAPVRSPRFSGAFPNIGEHVGDESHQRHEQPRHREGKCGDLLADIAATKSESRGSGDGSGPQNVSGVAVTAQSGY